MKKILLVGLTILAIGWILRSVIQPSEVETYVHEPTEPVEPLVLGLPPADLGPAEAAIYRTQVSEELIRGLSPRLRKLSQFFEAGDESTPDADLFADEILYTGVNPQKAKQGPSDKSQQLFKKQEWLVESESKNANGNEIWAALRSGSSISKSQFGVLSGNLVGDGSEFEMLTTYEGTLTGNDTASPSGFKSKQTLVWTKQEDGQWQLSQWHQKSLKTIESRSHFFTDVTESSIPDDATREIIERSFHIEMMLKEANGEDYPQKHTPTFVHFHDWHSSAVFPSVSVLDYDSDGNEDLFLTGEWTRPVLLRNKGDGTFEDATETAGLDFDEAHINCALFADFDNDGDQDAFLGRTSQPSLFLENKGGVFERDEEVCKELENCVFACSANAVDINRDGLLDLYISTYCSYASSDRNWMKYAIEEERRQELFGNVWGKHSYLNRGGIPNLMLINKDGKLKRTEISNEIEQWRNSFQAIWMDYDDDGDPDLYVCNDFSPDALLRNETKKGSTEVRFSSVTFDMFDEGSMAFGMGASVGDYDADGDLDLYVSNMYSKAGNRIFGQLGEGSTEALKAAAAGNFLYQKEGSKFTQVAGLENDRQHVASVGWSFGGQFADFDNDGQLDLYVPSGLFTAPKAIERPDDL